MREIPNHLLRYTVEQDYSLYTFEDQAVWRFIMRQLFSYLKDYAHPSYVQGLKKTGIRIDTIPNILEMDKMLSSFGWRAVPVSGFIPPVAFMSFQAHKILPIACEMRSIEHILYTPAPDIVHEAAGHAPILIDKDFTEYLNAYASIAQKAIISSEDIALYEAIRDLSDLKEACKSRVQEIKKAKDHLNKTIKNMTYVSEAQLLGRMNWWTAEYGLIGELLNPKLFGAGLLSSISEARNALTKPKLIEFNINCLNFSYDITEPQPQLFVAKNFESLISSLKKMSTSMAFVLGGEQGLRKAKKAKSVCTVETSSGESYSGIILDYSLDKDQNILSLKVQSPCLKNNTKLIKEDCFFKFNQITKVTSVYGGPSSYIKYPEFEDFAAKKVSKNPIKNNETEELLKDIRNLRTLNNLDSKKIKELKARYFKHSSNHWLAGLEILELENSGTLRAHLLDFKKTCKSPDTQECIGLGLYLVS